MDGPGNWFPQTKLQAFQPGETVIDRPRLLASLAEAVGSRRLTLISAPAGSGKTTLVASFIQAGEAPPAAWVTLDKDDDDPLVFVTLMIAALQKLRPGWGTEALELLYGLPEAQTKLRRIMGLLINDIVAAEPEPFILMLDDYHVITEGVIHETVDYLLEHLPPPLRLIITTRYEPPLALSRLRSRGYLAEFHLLDLRFDTTEVGSYLNRHLALDLSPEEVTALHKRTEGWAAGLRLLATTLDGLEGPAQRSAFISRFSHSNRLIFELLADEVLEQQTPELRTFLLQTSILPELTPALCTAVTENPEAPRLLEAAYRRNLFLVALDQHLSLDTTYRYHALFAAFLQRRLAQEQPDLGQELHRRAALAQPSPEGAIRHYLAAGLWAEAAALLEEVGRDQVAGRFVRRSLIERIQHLPQPVREARPWLQLVLGVYYAGRGEMEQSELHLEQALAQFQAAGDETGEIEVLVAECWRMGGLISPEKLAALAAKIETVPHRFTPDWIAGYHGAAEWFYLMRHDWPQVTEQLLAGMALAQQDWNMGALMTASGAFGPELLFNDQGIEPVEAFVLAALAQVPDQETIPRMLLQIILSYIRFYQARLDEAEELIRPAFYTLRQIGGLAWIDGHVDWLRLTLLLVRRQYTHFETELQASLERLAQNSLNAGFLSGFIYLQGGAAWLQGRLAEAQVREHLQSASLNAWFLHEDRIRQHILQGLLYLSQQDYEAAESALREAVKLHRQVRHTMLLHDPRLALALLYQRQGRTEVALAELSVILPDLRQHGRPGILLQEGEAIVPLLQLALDHNLERAMVESLLALLRQGETPLPIPIPDSSEVLTPREVEVLRLVATGASNRAIAEQLVISPRTAKAHMTHILAKLGADNRTQAVARARDLRLI